MPASDQFLRKLSTMHVVFAVSSVIMLVATFWMMAADHDDEWRDIQSTHDKIVAEKIKVELQEYQNEEYTQNVDDLNKQLEAAEENLEQNQARIDELNAEIRTLEHELDLKEREVRKQRELLGVASADYGLGVRDTVGETKQTNLQQDFNQLKGIVDSLEVEAQAIAVQLAAKQAELAELTKYRDEIQAELAAAEVDVIRSQETLTNIAPESSFQAFKRRLMEMPIVDGFNSHHKIIQDWLPELKITLGMTETARFDRCRTCHLAIDQIEAGNVPAFPFGKVDSHHPEDWVKAGKYPHPHATHPRTDVYLTAASPHPLPEFGCTICHEGQGSGTSFSNAAHAPNNPIEEHHWAEEYDYAHNHFWEYPMYPERFREASCIKCHHSVIELGVNEQFGPTAPKVYEGWQLVREYGCFGCHEIHGFDAGQAIGPDLRLEPQTAEEKARIDADPNLVAGQMRKVGPSLRHLASKTTQPWIEYWTEDPKRFRPDTRMPQFFHLTNQEDPIAQSFTPVEIAGLAQYLVDKSEPIELESPRDGYQADPARGAESFSQRGCLACHSHDKFPENHAKFGPNLSKIYQKIKPGEDGFDWLYTWVRKPELYHPRTKMPDLFLDPTGEGDAYVDPAADITAFLLEGDPVEFEVPPYNDEALDDLVAEYLQASNTITIEQVGQTMTSRRYPKSRDQIKSDEIELVTESGEVPSPEQWHQMKLNYIGRRSISRYGCFGCHEIKGFETARPIGTTLQDWGRKDVTKLAPEHIEQYLEHHGEPDGTSTEERIERAVKAGRSDEFASPEEKERELSAAYYYDSLVHHGRPGFLWQKLRQPRSYDYEKITTKRYDERLRMPKFPFDEEQIDAIATFILGLVAEPPSEEYVFHPSREMHDLIDGERLLQKYNCAGCHIIDLPKVRFGVIPDDVFETQVGNQHEAGLELLTQLKPPRQAETGRIFEVDEEGDKLTLTEIEFEGLLYARPDPLDDPIFQEYAYDLWENLLVGEKALLPGDRMVVPVTRLVETTPAHGGEFAEWLVEQLTDTAAEGNRSLAWQMAPPPLYLEGIKVQTPWLYQFLKNPGKLRHTTVLRMPKFNMDDAEADTLANYFAAKDRVAYPYQDVPEREPVYLNAMNAAFHQEFPDKDHDYLTEAWRLLNAPLCIKCHSLGGRQYQASDPKKDIRGPNLDGVYNRLRPDWVELWLFNPRWITPYTSMPAVYPKGQQQFPELFGGDASTQTIAARDALMNYFRLMEREGKYIPPASAATALPPAGD